MGPIKSPRGPNWQHFLRKKTFLRAPRALREGWAAGPSSVSRQLGFWPGAKTQVAPAGQAVIVMVWLGLESWSIQLNCSLGVIRRGVSLG